jgi:alkanesulfonate monooxygenase SsuD/methylene tetrahydromethanopterin reductase-like flavin-dependent oxidoreductase (luciferase family)
MRHYGPAMPSAVADLPAVSLVATPTKRNAVIEAAQEAERRGFPAIACPMLGGALGFITSLAHTTSTIEFFTSIQGIYGVHATELGSLASHVDEVSGGRFRLGLGVSHHAMTKRLGVQSPTPLVDIREYVGAMRANERYGGRLPPIYLAAMRDRMLDLALEIADGALWANASLRYTRGQVARVRSAHPDAHLGVMIPTVIDDDADAAAAVNRKTLDVYLRLPNYRNYWRAAGYGEGLERVEAALANGERDGLSALMGDEWLTDCTLYGSAAVVREGFAAWADIGVRPVAVMSSTSGGQLRAVAELFAAFA